jgi:excisionase family DNA binding protein
MHEENGCSGEREFMTPKEFAYHLRVDPQTVYRWIRKGRIEAGRVGRMRRIRVSEYYRFTG